MQIWILRHRDGIPGMAISESSKVGIRSKDGAYVAWVFPRRRIVRKVRGTIEDRQHTLPAIPVGARIELESNGSIP